MQAGGGIVPARSCVSVATSGRAYRNSTPTDSLAAPAVSQLLNATYLAIPHRRSHTTVPIRSIEPALALLATLAEHGHATPDAVQAALRFVRRFVSLATLPQLAHLMHLVRQHGGDSVDGDGAMLSLLATMRQQLPHTVLPATRRPKSGLFEVTHVNDGILERMYADAGLPTEFAATQRLLQPERKDEAGTAAAELILHFEALGIDARVAALERPIEPKHARNVHLACEALKGLGTHASLSDGGGVAPPLCLRLRALHALERMTGELHPHFAEVRTPLGCGFWRWAGRSGLPSLGG